MLPICPINFNHVEITDQAVPNVRPGYYINIFGNIYNSVSHRYKDPILCSDGRYYHTELKRRDGSRVSIMIHKLIMKVFNYIPGCEDLEVNHIDGNKHNNALWNLEWVTHQENMDHAKLNNLVKSGEQAAAAILTEDQVREICEILKSERYVNQYGDIAAKYNIAPVTVLEIANGTSWTTISCDYELDYNFRLNDRFSKEEVHKMCQIMQKYGRLDEEVYQHIFKELGIEHPTHNIKVRIKRIYDRNPGYFYKISSQYNW